MKKLLLLVACVFSFLGVGAQHRLHWGVEVGLGMSDWMGDHSSGYNAMFNPSVGVKLDIPLNGLVSFQTGLNWASKGVKCKENGVKISVNQNYLVMPLLAAFHIGTGKDFDVVLTAGPYLGVGVCGKTKGTVSDVTVSCPTFENVPAVGWKGLDRFDAGVRIGAGIDYSHFQIGLNGEFGCCNIQKDGPKNLGIFASFGYMF